LNSVPGTSPAPFIADSFVAIIPLRDRRQILLCGFISIIATAQLKDYTKKNASQEYQVL